MSAFRMSVLGILVDLVQCKVCGALPGARPCLIPQSGGRTESMCATCCRWAWLTPAFVPRVAV